VYDSVLVAMKMGESAMMVMDLESNLIKHYSRSLMCPTSGISYPEPEPSLFSFNSPYGACPSCKGLGEVSEIDIDKIIPNPSLSIRKGGFAPLGEYKRVWIFEKMEAILIKQGYSINTPIADLDEELVQLFLYGNEDMEMNSKSQDDRFEGIANFMTRHSEDSTAGIQRWAQGFMNKKKCPECHGARVRKEALQFKLNNQTIGDIAFMDFEQLDRWSSEIEAHLNADQIQIGAEILKEIRTRIRFILEVGLDYLTLHRSAKSLSGGEAQRIRLATQIGTELINVLYVLDEPSIGLHQRDNTKLIQSLKRLRDVGNSVLVVEHDKEMIEAADFIVDIGPGAGSFGGNIVSAGDLQSVLTSNSLTAQYLVGSRKIEIPKTRRKGNGHKLTLKGANGHNLQNVDFSIPLGTFTCVTGVSGSGKSSLINQTMYPLLMNHFNQDIRKP
jgi:excinuclease ABC subunit A